MNYKKFNLDQKVAIVTGGGSGIGRALSLGLAEAGADVVPVGRTASKIEDTAKGIKDLGKKTMVIPTDVTVKEQVEELVNKVKTSFGSVDVLVNCAGLNIKKPVLDLEVEDWEKVMEVNLKGIFIPCQVVGKEMVAKRNGKIINIASMGSYFGITGSGPYCASKGGVEQFTKVMAVEWAPFNVQANSIAPGFFRTELTKPVFENDTARERIFNRTPMNRAGEVEELVGAAVYLASEASDFVTGITLPVDGGFVAYGI